MDARSQNSASRLVDAQTHSQSRGPISTATLLNQTRSNFNPDLAGTNSKQRSGPKNTDDVMHTKDPAKYTDHPTYAESERLAQEHITE